MGGFMVQPQMEPMNAANIAELVGDHLHTFFIMFIAALLGSSLAQLYFRVVITPPTAESLRRRLGRLRRHFENVPAEKLDAALLATDRETQTGWHWIKSGLTNALWFSVAVTGFLVFRGAFPDLPVWYSYLGIALLAFVCSYVVVYLSECSLRRRLERFLNESGSA
jgi:hypothetical protein